MRTFSADSWASCLTVHLVHNFIIAMQQYFSFDVSVNVRWTGLFWVTEQAVDSYAISAMWNLAFLFWFYRAIYRFTMFTSIYSLAYHTILNWSEWQVLWTFYLNECSVVEPRSQERYGFTMLFIPVYRSILYTSWVRYENRIRGHKLGLCDWWKCFIYAVLQDACPQYWQESYDLLFSYDSSSTSLLVAQ